MYPESMYKLEERVVKLTQALEQIANLDLSEVTSKMNAMGVLAEMKNIATTALEH